MPVETSSMDTKPLQLESVVIQVIGKTESLLAQRGQRARTAYAALPEVLVDERRVQQVLANLLVNASEYSVDGDEIVIDAALCADAVVVSVLDHGPGFDPQDRPRIFERGYRGRHTTTSANRAGLGLSIVRGIVEAHKGHIGVEDVQPHGARFWFTLPLA